MKRREAIRNILIASAGTIFITGCSESRVVEFLGDGKLNMNEKHIDYLSMISDAFLPRDNEAGAVDTPATFIQTMLNECHSTEEIEKFALGFDQYKDLMTASKLKIKSAKSPKVITAVEEALKATEPQEGLIYFINTTKQRTIQHFLTSPSYMTDVENYQLVPQRFDGCIDV